MAEQNSELSAGDGGTLGNPRVSLIDQKNRVGVIIAAQIEEIAPVIRQFGNEADAIPLTMPFAKAWLVSGPKIRGEKIPLLCAQTGIGLIATASFLGWVTQELHPLFVISAGSAGGLGKAIEVGDVVVGTNYSYTRADATAFGYAIGQVPGQPETFEGSAEIIEAVPSQVKKGQILSSDAFITAKNVGETRELFPLALLTDMESAAAAQTCAAAGIPFASVRCASDLAGPAAEQLYHIELDRAADLSANAVRVTVENFLERLAASGQLVASRKWEAAPTTNNPGFAPSSPEGASTAPDSGKRERGTENQENEHHGNQRQKTRNHTPRFSSESLQAGLLYVFGMLNDVPATPQPATAEDEAALAEEFGVGDGSASGDNSSKLAEALGIVGGVRAALNADSSLTMTAKQYDEARAKIVDNPSAKSGENTPAFAWPPTSQTVTKRFGGYWNDALSAAGFAVRRGRKRGSLKFTDQDYQTAMREYVLWSRGAGKKPHFGGYSEWLEDTGNQGLFPSGAAIRQHYGSWSQALAGANVG